MMYYTNLDFLYFNFNFSSISDLIYHNFQLKSWHNISLFSKFSNFFCVTITVQCAGNEQRCR